MNQFLSILKKKWLRICLGLLVVATFTSQALNELPIPLVDRLDGLIYDLRLRLTAPGSVDPRVVIVDIDEKSLREREFGGEGRWPWPRNRLALLNQILFDDYGVNLVGYDVIFSERDDSSGIQAITELAKNELKQDEVFKRQLPILKDHLDFDAQFSKSFHDRLIVLGYSFLNPGNKESKGTLPEPVFHLEDLPPSLASPLIREGYTANLNQLQTNANDAGHINPLIDADGVIRRIPMLIQYQDGFYESLSLASARALLGGLPIQANLTPGTDKTVYGALESLDIGGAPLPLDAQLAAYIPYRGPYKSFEYISASDVFHQTVPKEKLEGKIVLIGTTAPGLLDLRATPVGNAYPGVEIHANLITGILDGNIKQAPSWAPFANLALIIILGFVLAIALSWMSPLIGSIASVMSILTVIGINLYAYKTGFVLPLAALLGTILLLYFVNLGYGYFIESRGKRLITGLFGQYVPPELVDEMAQDPSNFSMEGESRELTVLFSDVRGFTTISESLDAKTLSEFINAFLTPFTKIIYDNRGTIDKYMGDCIMAFWGAPIRDENHARNAVKSAFEMVKSIEVINADFAKRKWPPIKVGIGLNTGRMSVGNMGSEIRLAYTVMGDAVNLGSRLEGITKEYGVSIIIGPDTRAGVPDLIARELDKVKVKGKDIPVTIFEPLGFDGEVSPRMLESLALFDEALAKYRAQEWLASKSILDQLMSEFEDTGKVLFELYLERIEFLKDNPPGANWDGSYTFTKK
jgi:adenylate cyclase